MSIFGSSNATAPQTGGGLFGGANTQQQPTGSLFGNPAQNATQQTNPLFGGTQTTQPSIFGYPAATNTTNTTNTTGGGLFGQNTGQGAAGGGLFGGGQQQQQPAAGGGLFGSTTQQPAAPGGGLFGSTTQNPGTTGGGLFGSTQQPATGGGLFGSTTTQPQQQNGSFSGTSQQPAGGGLFGGKPGGLSLNTNLSGTSTPSTNPNPLFGGSLGQPQQQQAPTGGLFSQPQQQQAPTGGLFSQPQQQQAPGGLFSQPQQQQAPGGLFSQPQQQQAPTGGLFFQPQQQQAPTGGFLSQPQQQPGLFSQPSQSQARPSLFGQSTTNNNNPLFGGNNSTLGTSTLGGGQNGRLAASTLTLNSAGSSQADAQAQHTRLLQRLESVASAWNPTSILCRFQHPFYNLVRPEHVNQYRQPVNVSNDIWEKATRENPDPQNLVPVIASGFDDLRARVDAQSQTAELHKQRLTDVKTRIVALSERHSLSNTGRLHRAAAQQTQIMQRLLAFVQHLHLLIPAIRSSAIRPEEERLRGQLEEIEDELRRGRLSSKLNELWALIGAVNAASEGARVGGGGSGNGSEWAVVDEDGLSQIAQILTEQTHGLAHLTKILQQDKKDLHVIYGAGASSTDNESSHTNDMDSSWGSGSTLRASMLR